MWLLAISTVLYKGKASNGQKYYVFKMILISYDCNPHSLLFPLQSVGGFFFQPIGLCERRRRSFSSIRHISVTPHGVSRNLIFNSIIEDFLKASTNYVDAVDTYGQKFRIFFEISGFLANYPASSYVLDFLNHNYRYLCMHCTFRCGKGSVSRYSYSSKSTYEQLMLLKGISMKISVRKTYVPKQWGRET